MKTFFGFRKFSYPLKPVAPFAIGAVLTLYGVSRVQDSMLRSEAYRHDPRNPLKPYLDAQEGGHH